MAQSHVPVPARAPLDRDLSEVAAAVELVASGHAMRVSLTGLGHPRQAALAARVGAMGRGLIVEAVPSPPSGALVVLIRRGPTLLES
jgi:hypothetical protein